MLSNETIQNRIDFWIKSRKNLIQTYGQHARVVERASSIIGSLRLLRDHIGRSEDPIKATIESPEFILWPFYWDRCKELQDFNQ